jgi:hypothetical protein
LPICSPGRALNGRRNSRAVWLLSEGAISLILVPGDRGYSAAASEAAMMLVQQYTSEQIISGRSNR